MTTDLIQRIEAAMSREGKPRGDHMVEGYAMMAKAARAATKKVDRLMSDVYDCASRCIANETAMFEGLAKLMPEVRSTLEAAGAGSPEPRARTEYKWKGRAQRAESRLKAAEALLAAAAAQPVGEETERLISTFLATDPHHG